MLFARYLGAAASLGVSATVAAQKAATGFKGVCMSLLLTSMINLL